MAKLTWKIPDNIYFELNNRAIISGLTLEEFMTALIMELCASLDSETFRLSPESWDTFNVELESLPKPNAALKKLMSLPSRLE